MSYVLIHRAEINNANAKPAWWISGAPSLVSFCGFGHGVARQLGNLDNYRGICPVHHDIELLAMGREAHNFRGATFISHRDHVGKSKIRYGPLSLQPSVRAKLLMSFVLCFDEDTSIDMEKLTTEVLGSRIAGGNIANDPRIAFFNTFDEAISGVKGFAMKPRLDLVNPNAPLDTLKTLHPASEGYYPWVSLNCYGYRAVTAPTLGKDSREGCAHAYAEPLVAPVQYVSLRSNAPVVWDYQPVQDDIYTVGAVLIDDVDSDESLYI